jgi:hypothetical protein
LLPIAEATWDSQQTVAAARERLAALQAKQGDLPSLEAALKTELALAARQPAVLEAPSGANGLERLEAQLRSLAASSEAEVAAVRGLRMEEEAGLKALRLEISFLAPRERVADLIMAVETATPALFLEKVRVTTGREITYPTGDHRVEVAATVRGLAVMAAAPQASPGRR